MLKAVEMNQTVCGPIARALAVLPAPNPSQSKGDDMDGL
jgi:hypothetical protein